MFGPNKNSRASSISMISVTVWPIVRDTEFITDP
jgi:hypothetical protein